MRVTTRVFVPSGNLYDVTADGTQVQDSPREQMRQLDEVGDGDEAVDERHLGSRWVPKRVSCVGHGTHTKKLSEECNNMFACVFTLTTGDVPDKSVAWKSHSEDRGLGLFERD